jgi:hypothetical protein
LIIGHCLLQIGFFIGVACHSENTECLKNLIQKGILYSDGHRDAQNDIDYENWILGLFDF